MVKTESCSNWVVMFSQKFKQNVQLYLFTNLCYFFGREKMSSPRINMFVSPLVPLSRGAKVDGGGFVLRAID